MSGSSDWRRSRLYVWGPAVAQALVIFVASSIPDVTRLPGGISDHTGHFIGYAMLGAALLHAFAGASLRGVTVSGAVWSLAVSSLYGISDELHQSFVPGRTPDVHDWIADTWGAAVAIGVLSAVAFALRRRTREV
jgi:VanZ family protein